MREMPKNYERDSTPVDVRPSALLTFSLTESETEWRTRRTERVDLLENVSLYFHNSTSPISSKLRRQIKIHIFNTREYRKVIHLGRLLLKIRL